MNDISSKNGLLSDLQNIALQGTSDPRAVSSPYSRSPTKPAWSATSTCTRASGRPPSATPSVDPVDELTIVGFFAPDRKVPRDSLRLPAGRHAGENGRGNRYRVRIIDHGPEVSSLLPCQYGKSGECDDGNHGQCSHNPGGWQHKPLLQTGDAVMIKDEHGSWHALFDQSSGKRVDLLPLHGWRCSCECHDVEPVQLDLLAELDPNGYRVMVTSQGDRYLVTSMAELTNPADRNGPSIPDLYTHEVRARKWVKAKRRAYWGPELGFTVDATEWAEETGQ